MMADYPDDYGDHDGRLDDIPDREEREAEEGLPTREWEGPPWPTNG